MPEPISGSPIGTVGGWIFVSHAKADATRAMELVQNLEKNGQKCWIAPRDIPIGTDYANVITEAIEASSRFIVLVSKSASASQHVAREVDFAADAGLSVLPVRIDGSLPSGALRYHLKNRQIVPFDDALPQLLGNWSKQVGGDHGKNKWERFHFPGMIDSVKNIDIRITVVALVVISLSTVSWFIFTHWNKPHCVIGVDLRHDLTNGFLFPQSDRQAITPEQLDGFTADDLWIARNEIFARHGRVFQHPCLNDYFSKLSWYKPMRENVVLTSAPEKSNIDVIKGREGILQIESHNERSITLREFFSKVFAK